MSANKKITADGQAKEQVLQSVQAESLTASLPIESSTITLAQHAIDVFDYHEAIFLLEALSANEAIVIKQYWMDHSKAQIRQKAFNDAEYSLNAFLEYELDNVDFHNLYVDALLKQSRFKEAIEHAYSMQYYLFDLPIKFSSIEHARDLAQIEIEKHTLHENWFALASFCKEVIALDPQNMNFYWVLAKAQYHQEDYDSAQFNIEFLFEDPNFSVKAKTLQKKIDAMLLSPEEVPLDKQGEHFIVKGYVNDSASVNLLIDTGASVSMLSQERFNELSAYQSLEYVKTLTLNTAGGEIQAELYRVPLFSIEGYSVENMLFTVSPDFTSVHDGLLGMNFLRQFKFSINQDRETLSLEKK